MSVTFITGNQGKADQLAQWLEQKLEHKKLDLEEIQATDAKVVVERKVQQAYELVKKPVLVEDVELSCPALGGLPGSLVKWFVKDDVSLLCRIMNSFSDRSATVRVVYALHDGERVRFFEGSTKGRVADFPKGEGGFGWDSIFIPDGSNLTRAEQADQSPQDYEATSPRAKAIVGLRQFLRLGTIQ